MAGLSCAVPVDFLLALHTTKIQHSEMVAFSTEFQKFRSENCVLYLQASLDSVKDALLPRLHDLEHSVTDIDSRVTTLEATYASMTEKNKALQEKIDDLENCSRRQNLCIIGILEGPEDKHPTSFMSSFLSDVFGPAAFEKDSEVMRSREENKVNCCLSLYRIVRMYRG
ncbi:UNVERIFIED_CONTAM: hypothetical protein FKN15_028661 [Acipenser sinensis]